MSALRDQLERAKAAYQAEQYPGDLAATVLSPPYASGQRWRLMWALPPAIAALVALAVWMRPPPRSTAPTGEPLVTVTPNTMPAVVDANRPTLRDVPRIQYAIYVSQVREGMEDALGQLATRVDSALEAPVVTGSVNSVRQVAGELQDVASMTWEQIRPRPARGG